MVAAVALLVVSVAGAMVALAWHWQLRSAPEVVIECLARLVPRPARSPRRTRARAIAAVQHQARESALEQLHERAVPPHVVVRVNQADLRELVGSTRPEALAAQLTQQFPSRTATVEVIIDDRLQPGWVRAHAADQHSNGRPANRRNTNGQNGNGTNDWDATEVLPDHADLTPTMPEGAHDRHVLVPIRSAPALQLQHDGVLGRGREVDLRCDHPMVSRQHAHLRWTAGGWTVVDLQSLNGTYVDGVQIEGQVTLRPGQRIMFGQRGPEYAVRA